MQLTRKYFFFIAYYIETFSPQAKATAADVTINYPLTTQKNGCEFIENTRCPLEEEEYISYKLTMNVLKIFPKVGAQSYFFENKLLTLLFFPF